MSEETTIQVNIIGKSEDLMEFDDTNPQVFSLSTPKVGSKDCSLMKLGKQLLIKAKEGEAEEVRNLMSIGAPFTADLVGTSPLHWAVYYNHIEVTELLLKAGISRDARNKVDRTPSHIAAHKGFTIILRLLLAYGADVNCKDMLRMTPLHWAAQGGSVGCVQLLLDYGCDVNCVNKFDKTPLDIAKDNNHLEVVQLIELVSAEDPTTRMAKVTHFKEGSKIIALKKAKLIDNVNDSVGVKNKTSPSKKNRVGIIVTKPNPTTGVQSTLELIRDCETSDLPDCSKTVNKPIPLLNFPLTTAAENPEPPDKKVPLIIRDDGKLFLNSFKLGTNNDPKFIQRNGAKFVTTPKLVPANYPINPSYNEVNKGPKKIIKINATQLINMTKEKKLCITSRNSYVQNIQLFNGILTPGIKAYVEHKIRAKLQAAVKEAEVIRKNLEVKEKEIESYKHQLENLSRLGSLLMH
ncbi:GA-binding protein subunit beta-1 isoform X2 [Cimex lectularius]|nr:GA-binding protein subunit beta-1 isoform X2 [Cimex lectularius]